MNTWTCRCWILAALAASLGCSPSDDGKPSTVGTTLKQAGKDTVATAKDVGGKVADGVSSAADSLEDFIESAASKTSAAGEDLAQDVKAKMPDVESLVDKAKAQLQAGGADAKAVASTLDDKLATLKAKLETLAHNGAAATAQMKDDVVAAFKDLMADIKSGLSKLHS